MSMRFLSSAAKKLAKKTRIYELAMQSLAVQRLCGFSSIPSLCVIENRYLDPL